MPGVIKKGIWIILVAFVLFYVFTRPEDTAAVVRGFVAGFGPVIRFFQSLIP